MSRHDYLEAVARAVPAVLAAHGVRTASCILGTRVASFLLLEAGYRPTAIAAQAVVTNDAYWRLREQYGSFDDEDVRDRALAEGAWQLVIGPMADRLEHAVDSRGDFKGWDGHLLVGVNGRWLIDPTIGQFDRPAKGIVMPETFVAEAPQFVRGTRRRADFEVPGARLQFERLDDRSYLEAPDWRLPRSTHPLVRAARELATARRAA